MIAKPPHKLDLYRLAVQHPMAEVMFLLRAYETLEQAPKPFFFKEDFSGTAGVAAMWVALNPQDHHAVAVDQHSPTLKRAQKFACRELGHASNQVQFICDDVCNAITPQVDIIASLNFSTLIFHHFSDLVTYFQAAYQSLNTFGLFTMDLYGGPGAMRVSTQSRTIKPNDDDDIEPFEYIWEQQSYDAISAKTNCCIHFRLSDGTLLKNAFRYQWRLWTLPEIKAALQVAGFEQIDIWCDRYDPKQNRSDGHYRRIKKLDAREDWIVYITARKCV